MKTKNLNKQIKGQIQECIENDENLDIASWNDEEGVLITANEALQLINVIESYKAKNKI